MVVNGVMSEKRFVPSKYASHTHDVKTDKHYYVADEYVGCRELFDEIERLENENEQLHKKLEQIVENYNLTLKLDKKVYDKIRRLERENRELELILKQHEFAEKEGFK